MKRALLLLLVATGCAHQSSGRATVLEPGQAQLTPSVELDFISLRGTEESTNLPWAYVGMGYHLGVGGRTEVGLRVFGFGIPGTAGAMGVSADSKFQLFSADDREWGWDIAIGLSPSYHFGVQGDQPFHLFGFTVPLLFGKNFGRHQLILGLRFSDYVMTSYGQRTLNTVWGGASLGFSLRVRRIELMPEVAFMYSPVKFNGERPDEKRNGVAYVSFGLSVPINL
jgi:hypothetical protein